MFLLDSSDRIKEYKMPAAPDKILSMADYMSDQSGHIEQLFRVYTGVKPPKPYNFKHFLDSHSYRKHEQPLPDMPGEEDDAPTDSVSVYVNHGRWIWECDRCKSGILAMKPGEHHDFHNVTACPTCPFTNWKVHDFPANWTAIEEELLRQPGYLASAPLRSWHRDWTMEHLQERTAKALAIGGNPRALSIGLSHVWSIGERLTAAGLNLWISDLIDDLAGRHGLIEFEDDAQIGGGGGRGQLQLEPRTLPVPSYEGGISYDATSKSLMLDAGISGLYQEVTFPTAIATNLQDGDILIRDSTQENNWLRLPAGTAGQVLTSRGPNQTPHWA